MNQLPKWAIANPFPAIHDFESLTVIDQTARIYGAMNSLITEYNKFADDLNKFVAEFSGSETASREEFEHNITTVMNEFRCSMERYLVLNLDETTKSYLNTAINEGRFQFQYDPETESLDFVITEVNGNG